MRLGPGPKLTGVCPLEREDLAVQVPFTEVMAFEIEPLDPKVLPVRNVNRSVRIYRNPVWQVELLTGASRSAPGDVLK